MPRHTITILPLALLIAALPLRAGACPFCSAASQTLSEELAGMDVAVIADLVEPATEFDAEADAASDPNAGTAVFRIAEVLKGDKLLNGAEEFRAVYFGSAELEKKFLLTAMATERLDWTMPLPLSPDAVEYIEQLQHLPPGGVERLAFFKDYLENPDPMLAQDAYDEFSRAPYSDILALADRLDHDRLETWINDPEIGPTRRRLYLTLLGACGTAEDTAMLERLLRNDYADVRPAVQASVAMAGVSGAALGMPIVDELLQADERRRKQCLDALIAAYLKLKGPDGLPLVEERFLANPRAEYTNVYSALMALRFHGDEPTSNLPKDRLIESFRLLLDNEEIAEQVIPDLARLGDWGVLDRLVDTFRESEPEAWIRSPVVSYLMAAEEQGGEVGERATAALDELEELDPKTVKLTRQYSALALMRRGAPATSAQSTPDAVSDVEPEPQATDQPPAPSAEEAITPTDADANPVTPTPPEPSDAPQPPSTMMIVGVPILAALLLMGVYALLLRAVDLRSPGES